MPSRQQRSPNFRGQVQSQNRYTRNVIPVNLVIEASPEVRLGIPAGTPDLIITGVPQLLDTGASQYPTSATDGGGFVLLTYPAPLVPPLSLILLAGDPAVRTADGSFLAPIDVEIPALPYPANYITTFDFTVTSKTGHDAVLTFDKDIQFLATGSICWRNTAGTTCTLTQTGANELTANAAANWVTGDHVFFPPQSIYVLSVDLDCPTDAHVLVP